MALAEIIKYEGDNTNFIWKHPSVDFNNMTELIVHEGQEAIFVSNGVAADTFPPGRYTLDSKNIPFLTNLIDKVTGVSVYHCEIYFINKTVKMAVKWGTDSRVRFIEPTYQLPIDIGAHGEMNLSVCNGRKMLLKLVGAKDGIAWEDGGQGFTKSLQASFRPMISMAVKTRLSAAIQNRNIDIVDVDKHLGELAEELMNGIKPEFEEYGLTVEQLYVAGIDSPQNDPNLKLLYDLHTTGLKKGVIEQDALLKKSKISADTDVEVFKAAADTRVMESKASLNIATAMADAKVKEAQREAILQDETTLTEQARQRAEREMIEAQAAAQKVQVMGMAEASVMKAKGYDQKDLIQADIQKTYAESIGKMGGSGSSGGSNSVMGDMVRLNAEMAAMRTITPQVSDMMNRMSHGDTIKCPKCGNSLPAHAKFCLECGTKIEALSENEMICPACGKKTPKGKFCMECGAPLANKCPNCGAEVPQGGKFCLECGTKLI